MGRTLTASSKQARELIPAGAYRAVVIGFAHIGTQTSQYGTKEQCIVTWEVQKKGQVAGQISKFYTFSFHAKSTFRQDMEAMMGRVFEDGDTLDPESLIDFSCRLSIVHEPKAGGGTRDVIASLMPLDEDDTPAKAQTNGWYYECPAGPDGFDIPSDLPEWIATRVKQSSEYTGMSEPVGAKQSDPSLPPVGSGVGVEGDEIPY